ncbi:MAG: adenylyltransferase/cytidyltransferase family protein [Pseudomonadota bacterium]
MPRIAAVTGRFQPFHNDHLELVSHAMARADAVIIGITNPDERSRIADVASAHRHTEAANPFSYFDRQRIVRAALLGAGFAPGSFTIVPFPLDQPGVWADYIPAQAVQFVRVFSPWERRKAELLESGGYAVEVLEGDPATRIHATEIRRAIGEGRPWAHWLPEGAIEVLRSIVASSPAPREPATQGTTG